MNIMIICLLIDYNKIFYKKNGYCVFRVYIDVYID